MRNRAEKDAVRWCHLTHQFIAGASVHSREPIARVAEVYPYFVSKRFINHSIIIKSCQTCPAHIVMCYNAKTGVTETLLTIIFEPKTARFTSVLSYIITSCFFFFLILWLFNFSAILLLLAFASSGYLICKFMSKHMRNYARCYELMC